MGKQKHDIGYQKKQRRGLKMTDRSPYRISTDQMARSLVDRGLASRQILNSRTAYRGDRR